MQPLGNKILVRDITNEKKIDFDIFVKTDSGLFTTDNSIYRKVTVETVSEDSETKLKQGDICLCLPGGVELEKGLWLINESLLDCKL